MSDNGLSFLKAIGIRVHTVRYQKIRKRAIQKDPGESISPANQVTSSDYKRIRGSFCLYRVEFSEKFSLLNIFPILNNSCRREKKESTAEISQHNS